MSKVMKYVFNSYFLALIFFIVITLIYYFGKWNSEFITISITLILFFIFIGFSLKRYLRLENGEFDNKEEFEKIEKDIDSYEVTPFNVTELSRAILNSNNEEFKRKANKKIEEHNKEQMNFYFIFCTLFLLAILVYQGFSYEVIIPMVVFLFLFLKLGFTFAKKMIDLQTEYDKKKLEERRRK